MKLVTKHKSVSNQSNDGHEFPLNDGLEPSNYGIDGHFFKNRFNTNSLSNRDRSKKIRKARQRDLNLCVIVAYSGGVTGNGGGP
jgi:hypothetical protein